MKKISLILFFNALLISAFPQTNTFPTTGNVGIGTTSPSALLHVNGDAILGNPTNNTYGKLAIQGPNLPATSESKRDIAFEFQSAGSALIRSYRGSTWDTYLQFLTTKLDAGFNSPSVRMHINHDGKIGIGTISPTEMLEVAGNIKSYRGNFIGQTPGANASHGSLELREIGAVTTTQTSDDYAPRLILHWSGINSKSIALGRNGNIKFNDQNSTTAYAKIETGEILGYGRGSFTGQTPGSSFSHGSLELREIGGVTTNQGSDDYAPRLTFHWAGRLSSSIAMGTSGNLKFNAQGSTTTFTGIEVGNIFSNGNVAINTATVPTGYKLAVKGNVIAEKLVVKTSTTWPDFVFKKDYKLPSLNEVEQFIAKNSHLPEIPSAKEIESTGQDLGEMNRLLLKKVEELTLYLIDQKKTLEKQNSDIETLKNKIKRLENR